MLPAHPFFLLLGSLGSLEVLGFAFWIWMIFHCATREPNSSQKILWLLLVVCIPDIGSLIYFLVRVVKIRG